MMARNVARLHCLILLVAGVALSGCGMYDDEPLEGQFGPEYEQRRSQLTDFCEVRVDGHGTLSVEDEYLAQVVTCEHGGAPMETLKAQAIAARGYAKYVADVEGRPLSPTVRDQAYNCGRPATDRARQAVRETAGKVLTHNGKLIMPFYVAGSTGVDSNSCRASGGAPTQRYVTYNQGRIGSQVQASTLGWTGSPANRGAMSQNGSACLAEKGWKAERILRFFYGDDIRVTQLSGACVDSDTDPALGGGSADDESSETETNSCEVSAAEPQVITRSTWGARAPKANRRRHTPKRFSIHHTVTSNDDSSPMATIRGIQRYHQAKGWGDIGYHYVIDQQGRTYSTSPVERIGAHTAGQNTGNIGIGVLGNFETAQPTDKQLRAIAKLIAYLSDKYDIEPSNGVIKTHSHYGSTTCPGAHLSAKLDEIIGLASGASCGSSEMPDSFKYVRVRAVAEEPYGDNDTVEGFELDSVYGTEVDSNATHMATGVVSSKSASGTNAVLGQPDNTSCENRSSTVAGIAVGGEVVVELANALEVGDAVNIVQANYNVAFGDCSPSGTAEVAVSADGNTWFILSSEISGNASLPLSESMTPDPDNPPSSGGDSGGGSGGDTGGDTGGGGMSIDTQMAGELGREGGTCSGIGNGQGGPRCSNGRGGYSTGSCWAYVKAAMIRAGLADRADINQLAARVGMTGYAAQISAAGFKRAADRASDADLKATMGLKRVNTPPTEAPRGAVIAWSAGCLGYHSQYGHIEIAQGDGYACSDYCGRVRQNASCGSVYVPVD